MLHSDVPAKVLECLVISQVGDETWPYDDNTNDPFWRFGSSPKDYRWDVVIEVQPQRHSSHKTRQPHVYNGMDIKVGDYIANSFDGTAVRIARIDFKSETHVECLVEDVFRYNTFRDSSGLGNGIFTVPTNGLVFSLNGQGQPLIDPLPPSGVGPTFYPNLMSRFQNQDRVINFPIDLVDHGFSVGDLVSADPDGNTFVLTSQTYPYMIGRVSTVADKDTFMVNPTQKIVDDLDYLEGDLASILYADNNNPGEVALTGKIPVYVKLRDFTTTQVTSTISNANTTIGNIMAINGVNVIIGGDGDLDGLAYSANLQTANTGVTANVVNIPNVIESERSDIYAEYGEVFFEIDELGPNPSAYINDVLVEFSTTVDGQHRYNIHCASATDMAQDINAASVPGIVAKVIDGSLLRLTETTGAAIVLENVINDVNNTAFAGPESATGLPLNTSAKTERVIRLVASDARSIDIANKAGNPIDDFGLYSVENGTKAAALYVRQGIAQASTYVVADISARDNLMAIIGDQAHVLNKGDGEWGQYLFDGSSWMMISSYESARSDANTYQVEIDFSDIGSPKVIGEVSDMSKVTVISVEVTQAFNTPVVFTIGDAANNSRLGSDDQFDLSSVGTYVVMPTYLYDAGIDFTISAYSSAGSAPNAGHAVITLSYQ